MRLLIVTAVSMLMLISGAFAQSNSSSATPSERAKRETQDLEKARSEAQRPGAKGDKQKATQTGAAVTIGTSCHSSPRRKKTIRSVECPANGCGMTTTATARFSATRRRRNSRATGRPDTGDYFKADWLKPYHDAPPRATLTIYGASDYAVTEDGGDYTVHVVVGVDPESRIYLLDVWRQQTSPDQWIEAFCDLALKWQPMQWAEEQGQIRASIGPFLDQRARERKAYVSREQFPTCGDKARRAQSIRGRMALDGLYVPERAPWYANFRAELLSFPVGKHDDQVDALGLIGQLLDKMVVGRAVEKPEEKQTPGTLRMRAATIRAQIPGDCDATDRFAGDARPSRTHGEDFGPNAGASLG
jgi:predicted phage terminase large subunit-like protein